MRDLWAYVGGSAVNDFAKMLAAHDWYYSWSDDYTVWNAGQEAHDALVREYESYAKTRGERAARELWNRYAPKEYRMEARDAG